MRTFNKIIFFSWIVIGLPLTIIVNFWAGGPWIPFPVDGTEDFGYYLAWLIAFIFIYLMPLYLLVAAFISLARKKIERSGADPAK